jgi:hypothetical protein
VIALPEEMRMASLPYISAPGNIDKALKGIKSAATPESVSQDFVKTILAIKGGAGNQITAYLRKIGFATADWTCPVSVDSFLSSLLGDLCLDLPPFGILQRRAVWRRRRQKRRVLSWRSRVPVSPFVIDRRSIANG